MPWPSHEPLPVTTRRQGPDAGFVIQIHAPLAGAYSDKQGVGRQNLTCHDTLGGTALMVGKVQVLVTIGVVTSDRAADARPT